MTCILVNQWTLARRTRVQAHATWNRDVSAVCLCVPICVPVNLTCWSFVACNNIFAWYLQHCEFHTPVTVSLNVSCRTRLYACILLLTIRGTFNWLNWSRFCRFSIASMFLLLLPRLVSHIAIADHRSGCLSSYLKSTQSPCTSMQQLFNLMCLPFVLPKAHAQRIAPPLPLPLLLFHLNGCQMCCCPLSGRQSLHLFRSVSPQRKRAERGPSRKWI